MAVVAPVFLQVCLFVLIPTQPLIMYNPKKEGIFAPLLHSIIRSRPAAWLQYLGGGAVAATAWRRRQRGDDGDGIMAAAAAVAAAIAAGGVGGGWQRRRQLDGGGAAAAAWRRRGRYDDIVGTENVHALVSR